MTDRKRPDMQEAEAFSADIYSGKDLRARRSQAQQERGKKRFRRVRNAIGGAVGVGLTALAVDHGADKQAVVDAEKAQDIAPIEKQVEAQTEQHVDDARIQEAINRAETSVAASEPAPTSGVIEVSEAGTTGYVDLDNPNPEDVTTVDSTIASEPVETGGVAPEQETGTDTGGVSATDSTTE